MGVREDAILSELVALLPPGDALPQGVDSNLANVLRVSARSIDRLEELAEFVASDFDPRQTTSFAADWERVLGLPECGTLAGTMSERRAEVLEKYTRQGTLRGDDLIAAAATLGFTITIHEHWPYPPRSEALPLGDAHVFHVIVPALSVKFFRASESKSGDSLGSFGDARLLCLLDGRKPAHLNYGLTVP